MQSIINNLKHLNNDRLRSLNLSLAYAKNNNGKTDEIVKEINKIKEFNSQLEVLIN